MADFCKRGSKPPRSIKAENFFATCKTINSSFPPSPPYYSFSFLCVGLVPLPLSYLFRIIFSILFCFLLLYFSSASSPSMSSHAKLRTDDPKGIFVCLVSNADRCSCQVNMIWSEVPWAGFLTIFDIYCKRERSGSKFELSESSISWQLCLRNVARAVTKLSVSLWRAGESTECWWRML
jgi:hypothetical protein